jgi:hypothetical protein
MGSGKGKAPKTAEEKAKAVADRKAKVDVRKASAEQRKAEAVKAKAARVAAKKPPYKPGEGGRGLPPKPAGGMGRGLADLAKKTKAAAYDAKVKKMGVGMGGKNESAGGMAPKVAAPKVAAPKATSFKDTPKQSGDTPKRGEDGYVLHKKGGSCKKYARGGGIEVRGKTKGKFI